MDFNRDKLVNWFIKNFGNYYLDMMNSQHYVDPLKPNIFHAEGSVWTHTMMVTTWVEALYSKEKFEDYISLLTTGLLHDLGKPSCEEQQEANDEKPLRNSFKGHEGVSAHLSIAVLKALKQDFPLIYTDDNIETIIKLVGTHGVAVDNSTLDERLTRLRCIFRECDKRGAIRMVDEGLFSQYEKRKYSPLGVVDIQKELVILTGQPCAGKSTLIKERYSDYTVISRDSFLMSYADKTLGLKGTYNEIYRYLRDNEAISKLVDSEFEKYLSEVAKTSNKVVIDMTMMPMSSRRKMCNKFPKFRRKSVVLMTDINTITLRNEQRALDGKYISPKVFHSMRQGFVYPVLDEGFESIELIIN